MQTESRFLSRPFLFRCGFFITDFRGRPCVVHFFISLLVLSHFIFVFDRAVKIVDRDVQVITHFLDLVQKRLRELASFFKIPRDLIEIFFELVDVSQLLNDISFVVNDDREFFDSSIEKNAAAKLGYG